MHSFGINSPKKIENSQIMNKYKSIIKKEKKLKCNVSRYLRILSSKSKLQVIPEKEYERIIDLLLIF